MNLISFKHLNTASKRKIINIVSSNYPYEDIDDIYKFFLHDLFEYNIEYYIRIKKRSLVGIGYRTNKHSVDLYWPFIYSKDRYLGQHTSPFFNIDSLDIESFIELYNLTIKPISKKVFAYSSDYGMEKEIKNILINMGFNQQEITQQLYWGDKYKHIVDVKNDDINYSSLGDAVKSIRQDPNEKIYILSN